MQKNLILTILMIFTIFSCSSNSNIGGGTGTGVTGTNTYAIGGTINGLAGTLVLQNNGGDNLTLTADGAFTFAAAIADSTAYVVTVLTNPTSPNQICTASNNTGTVSGADVTNVSLVCSSVFDNEDGTVTDSNTTLVWKKCSQGQNNDVSCTGTAGTYQYCNANDHSCDSGDGGILNGIGTSAVWTQCNNLNSNPPGGFAGRTSWRTPTKDELKTLVYCSNGPAVPLPDFTSCNSGSTTPTIDTTLFPNTVAPVYWSSSTYVGSINFAWRVYFNGGNSGYNSKTLNRYVRCVTTGP